MIYDERDPVAWNMLKRLVDPEGPWLPSFIFLGSAVVAGALLAYLIR